MAPRHISRGVEHHEVAAAEQNRQGDPSEGAADAVATAKAAIIDGSLDVFAGELKDEQYDEAELAMALAGLPSVPEPA